MPIAGRETLLAPPGFAQGGYAVASHGNEIVVLIAGGPTGEPTDVHTVTFDANEAVSGPRPLHVRRSDATSQEASIALPGAAYAGSAGIAFWQETVMYPGFGSQTSIWARRIGAPPDDARLVLAGPQPVGSCWNGFYGDLAVTTTARGEIVGLWRTGAACAPGTGGIRLFGLDSGTLDVATLAFGPLPPAATAPGAGAPVEGLSDGALATGDASTLGVWWQRRYEEAGPIDSIEANLLGGTAGSRRRLSEGRSGSSHDPACNVGGSTSCLVLAQDIAAPAATSHGSGFLVAWVGDPGQDAPPDGPRRTSEMRALLLDARGAPDDRGEAIVADDDVVKHQPLAASDGAHTLVAWLEAGADGGGSIVRAIAVSSGARPSRSEAVVLAEDVTSAALAIAGGRFVLVVERAPLAGAALYAVPIAIEGHAASDP